MNETDIMRRVQYEATKCGARLFRNNVGGLKDARGRFVRYGLCVGSADLIGWTRTGQFLAVEVKTPIGIVTPEQDNFLKQVIKAGGVAFVARSAGDVAKWLS